MSDLWSIDPDPDNHTCEFPIKGILCMDPAEDAIYSGWVDLVWLCKKHLKQEVKRGWECAGYRGD